MRFPGAALMFILLCSNAVFAEERIKSEQLEEVVVTSTREAEPLKEKPQTIGVIKGKEIKDVKPSHPAEIMNRVPGVWVGVTAGEGHLTAIRQPLTTNPVYLFLEDGIPVRSTGFFNHNALYEINIPGAERIEVMKGPATALYGSDAIGGTINVITRPSPSVPDIELNPEAGDFGWHRLLASGGNTWGDNGFRIDLNTTSSDGWRERSGYKKESASLRWDHFSGTTAKAKTVIAFSDINQETGGSNGLVKADYDRRPWYNYQTFDFRKVKALRISTELEKELEENALLSIIPYARWNRMDLLPGWGIFKSGTRYFGYESTTEFYSLGLLTKYRHDFGFLRSRFITGIDLDYTSGQYLEKRIKVNKNGDKYVSYAYAENTDNNYDYDAVFTGISPYVQIESSPFEKLRLTAGARYDNLSYDYDTKLAQNSNRPASTGLDFNHVSPKAGLTYGITKDISGFISYNHGFRVPSSGDLFRGTASTAINLRPIKADSYELGTRGKFAEIFTFNTAVYYMLKKDDIVSFSSSTGVSERLNAGKTEHKGIELGIGVKPINRVEFNTSLSYASHRYKSYKVSNTADFSGKEIPQAPRTIANTRLDYKPALLNGGLAEIEWVRLGKYWMDDANTETYKGHDLFNARASYSISKQWEIYIKVVNIADKLYAERASKSGSDAAQFAPGQPRTFFAGINYKWGGK
ncbi:MAG: TonB-dependent receptor [Thermodesulfovibrionales bacterium]